MEHALLTGLALAAPAGLNAYIPLLALALAARFSDQVALAPPFDALASTPVTVVLLLLLTVEIVVDKVPGADHVNDLISTIIRPAAGAILMLAAASDAVELSPALLAVVGILAAGSVHAVKASVRPALSLGTAGMFNPLASAAEDALAIVASLAAIFAPVLALILLILFVVAGIVLLLRHRQRRPAS